MFAPLTCEFTICFSPADLVAADTAQQTLPPAPAMTLCIAVGHSYGARNNHSDISPNTRLKRQNTKISLSRRTPPEMYTKKLLKSAGSIKSFDVVTAIHKTFSKLYVIPIGLLLQADVLFAVGWILTTNLF